MGLLKSLIVLLATGCYTPDLQDCAVTCSSDDDCATGQHCGDRALCASSGVVCGAPSTDAAQVGVDAPTDADDPPASGTLRIKISDQGSVDVSGVGVCDSAMAPQCDFVVELGVLRTLVATPHGNRYFEMWMKGCSGQMPTCAITPTAPFTEVEAKFKKD